MHNLEGPLARRSLPPRYQGMCLRLPLFLAVIALASLFVRAADSRLTVEGETLQLPDMKVSAGKEFVFPEKKAITPADFPSNAPYIDVQYPGHAFHEGVATGRATVGVMLDPAGRAVDFLLIRYTRDYFGKALLEEAQRQEYRAKRLHGTAIPATFTFSYHFEPPTGLSNISSFEAAERRAEEVGGGPQYIYEPHREEELDGRQLEPLRVAIPQLPASYVPPDPRPLKVLVSFYVDEQGRVRLPNVESVLPPELVAPAIAALQHWAFRPPTIKAKPVLARAMRAVTFRAAPVTS
jgi:hypothetical protein